MAEQGQREIDAKALDTLFRDARSQNKWTDQPVSDDEIRRIYELVKMGPTSMNTQPARFVFLRTKEAKERLKPTLSPGNVNKTMSAPAVAIVAHDTDFHHHLPKVFPHSPDAKKGFEGDDKLEFRKTFAFRNGTLSGAYLIMAIRAIGLDAGPMSGFDNAKVDEEFFKGTTVKSNFIVAFGHGDPSGVFGRLPRLDFDEACKLL